jgi:hemerythrin-like domain-containing protein
VKRDVRLHGLTSDHHHALRLATSVQRCCREGTADSALIATVLEKYEAELKPHFEIEEQVLLPSLAAVGAGDLARRTRTEHRELEALLADAAKGDLEALGRFAARLEAHVHFEERTLFPACEDRLETWVLDAAARRAPKARPEVGETP